MKMSFVNTMLIVAIIFVCGCGKRDHDHESARKATGTNSKEDYSYTIDNVHNNVSWSSDDSIWMPCTRGMTIQAGWYIESGKHSCAILKGIRGDIVILGERSKIKLVLEELSRYSHEKTGARGFTLLNGLVTLTVNKIGSRFIVETPTAIAQVKGTQFTVQFDEQTNVSDVSVLKGQVLVTNKKHPESEPVLVSGGEKSEQIGIEGTLTKRMMTKVENESFIDSTKIDNIFSEPVNEDSVKGKSTAGRIESRRRLSSTIDNHVSKTDSTHDVNSGYGTETDSIRRQYTNQKEEMRSGFNRTRDSLHDLLTAEKDSSRKSLDSIKDAFHGKTEKSVSTHGQDMFDEMKARKTQ
jgi:hypothetical protein